MTFVLRVHCEDIPLGGSGGVEGFALGMISGLSTVLDVDRLRVLVPGGCEAEWRARLGPGIRLQELSAGGGPRPSHYGRALRAALRRSPLATAARAAIRERAANRASGDVARVVDYFPFHRVRTYGPVRFVTVHDLRVFSEDFADLPSQRNVAANVAAAKAVFASWRHPCRELRLRFPEAAGRIHEIPFPPMLDVEDQSRPRTPSRFLLYPAATSAHKNHRLLIKYLSSFPNAPRIVCVGPQVEPEFSRLKESAHRAGVDDRISFHGMVDRAELQQLYETCQALVMPSRYEAASGPVMEAFARGVPVVAADIQPLRDQIDQCGGDVAWFDPGSPASLAKAVEAVNQDYERFATAARAGGDWYAKLSWSRTAQEYLRVIRQSVPPEWRV
jgi:glycosyltransferase involved in cell wall biosynthesis